MSSSYQPANFGRSLIRQEIGRNILHAQHQAKLQQMQEDHLRQGSLGLGTMTQPPQSELLPADIRQMSERQTGELHR